MNRTLFYAHLRRHDSGVFGTSLSQQQVDGMGALLDAGRGLPLHHMANVLARSMSVWLGAYVPVA